MNIPIRLKGLGNGRDIGNGNGTLTGNDIDGAMDYTQRKITASGLCYGLFVNGVRAAIWSARNESGLEVFGGVTCRVMKLSAKTPAAVKSDQVLKQEPL